MTGFASPSPAEGLSSGASPCAESVPASGVADAHLTGRQTPCFVYDVGVAAARYRALRAALPDRLVLAYAVKANPGGPLLAALADAGAWFDCASAGEVSRVLATGAAGERIAFAGPGKSAADLAAARLAGARIDVDGIEDVERLAALAGPGGIEVNVRVHPVGDVGADFTEATRIIGGAGPSAFGVDEECLAEFVAQAAAYPRVRIRGLHVFAASNELSSDRLLASHAAALRIGRVLDALVGPLDLIDLGGGLGIPYAEGETEVDLERLGSGLAALLAEHDWFTGRLLLEPGRWLSGPCGVYLTRVVRVKHSRGTSFAVVEGGINHLLRPLLTGQSFPVRVLGRGGGEDGGAGAGSEVVAGSERGAGSDRGAGSERGAGSQQGAGSEHGAGNEHVAGSEHAAGSEVMLRPYVLAGPLCTSLDRIGEALLPPVRAGDVLVLGQAGAYGRTQAMTEFLSRPGAAEHWV